MDLQSLDDDGPVPLPPLTGRSHQAGAAAPVLPWGARLRSGLMGYLPVLLMALLAATTWWLVKRSPIQEGPRPTGPVSHEPDYEMRGFSVQHYTATGPAQGIVEGDVARHFPDTDTLEIEGVRVRWTDSQGRMLHAKAARARAGNTDGVVTLDGDAQVTRDGDLPGEPPLIFEGETLVFDTRNGRVSSDLPVTVRQGAHEFTAGSIRYDHESRIAELDRGVQGRLQPAHPAPR